MSSQALDSPISQNGGDSNAGDRSAGQMAVFFDELFNHDFAIAQQGLLGNNNAQQSLPEGNVGQDGSITFGPSLSDSRNALVLNDFRNSENITSNTAKRRADRIFDKV